MNNVFNPREIYTIRGDMCYDNKIMVNTTLPEQQIVQSIAVNVAEHDSYQESPRRRVCLRLSTTHVYDILMYFSILCVIGLIQIGIIPNTKLGFTCKDPKYSYPFRGDTITTTMLVITCCIGSLLMIILVEMLREKSLKRVCIGTVWHYYKELLLGVTFVLLATQIIKVIVGEPRPHFFDSCQPAELDMCQPGAFVEDYQCMNTKLSHFFLVDITRSFPSGHSSISLFTALFLSYLIQIRIPSFSMIKLLKPLLVSIVLTWSAFCSLTRITDRRHHWWDVLAGAVIGAAWALYTLTIFHHKERPKKNILTTNTSTTTFLDIKNKDATSVII